MLRENMIHLARTSVFRDNVHASWINNLTYLPTSLPTKHRAWQRNRAGNAASSLIQLGTVGSRDIT